MSRTVIWILGITTAVLVACILLGAGFLLGQAFWSGFNFWPATWMGRMMGNFSFPQGILPGGRSPQPGYGMMSPGMMGGYGSPGFNAADPLSIDEAEQALESFLEDLGNPDLVIKEIMIFDNHAYAEIAEKSTGIGAMEVLIDPVTKRVFPEHGPNMMWNLKYSPMASGGFGMMGGMMGGYRWGNAANPPQVSPEMPISPEEAVAAAQEYLNSYFPGTSVEEHVDTFYGYYTLHTLQDGRVTGMLSVNGFSGEVFPHTWHGVFIEMKEEE